MSLFDPGPAIPAPEPVSYGRRLTIRRRVDLAAGRHPVTRLPLLDPERGLTCASCAHLVTPGWYGQDVPQM